MRYDYYDKFIDKKTIGIRDITPIFYKKKGIQPTNQRHVKTI